MRLERKPGWPGFGGSSAVQTTLKADRSSSICSSETRVASCQIWSLRRGGMLTLDCVSRRLSKRNASPPDARFDSTSHTERRRRSAGDGA